MVGHVWLIGMMGSGKSAVGKLLASRLGRAHFDTDDEVAARTGCSIAQLWGERGEAAFRSMESAALLRLADGEPAVISAGGGAVLDTANVAAMRRSGHVVWLTAFPESLAERVGDGSTRPLLGAENGVERLAEILSVRAGTYADAAHVIVATDDVPLDVVAERIEEQWSES